MNKQHLTPPQLFRKPNYLIVEELKSLYADLRNQMLKYGGSVNYFKETPIYEQYMKIGKILGPRK